LTLTFGKVTASASSLVLAVALTYGTNNWPGAEEAKSFVGNDSTCHDRRLQSQLNAENVGIKAVV